MPDEASESLRRHAEEVAEHSYEVSDYDSGSELSAGLAETHEQLSDTFAAGTSDGAFLRSSGRTKAKPNTERSPGPSNMRDS